MNEELYDRVYEKLESLDWSDSVVTDIMEGFYNSPLDAIEATEGEISDSHLETLAELLNVEIEEEEEDD